MSICIYSAYQGTHGEPVTNNVGAGGADIKNANWSVIMSEVMVQVAEGTSLATAHPDWIRKNVVRVETACELRLTFLANGTGSAKNSGIAYFVFDLDDEPTEWSDLGTVFIAYPNCGESGDVNPGDSLRLPYSIGTVTTDGDGKQWSGGGEDYTFPANTGVGFIVSPDSWDGSDVTVSSTDIFSLPALNGESDAEVHRHHMVSFRSTEDEGTVVFCVADESRTDVSDDFRGLTFGVTPSDMSCLSADSYNSLETQEFVGAVLCEDLVASTGDMDYNDLVMEYQVREQLNGVKLEGVKINLRLVARGANRNHNFGVKMPGIKTLIDAGRVIVVREDYSGAEANSTKTHLTTLVGADDLVPLVTDDKTLFPPASAYSANTVDGETVALTVSQVHIVFTDGGVTRADLGDLYFPYNFYLEVYDTAGSSVETTLYSDTAYGDVSSQAAAAGVSTMKKIMVVPGKRSWKWAKEQNALTDAYPGLLTYLAGGVGFLGHMSWYEGKNAVGAMVRSPETYVDPHTWNSWFTAFPIAGNVALVPWGVAKTWASSDWGTDCDWTDAAKRSAVFGASGVSASALIDWDGTAGAGLDSVTAANTVTLINRFGRCYLVKDGAFANNKGKAWFVTTKTSDPLGSPADSMSMPGDEKLQLGKSDTPDYEWFLVQNSSSTGYWV